MTMMPTLDSTDKLRKVSSAGEIFQWIVQLRGSCRQAQGAGTANITARVQQPKQSTHSLSLPGISLLLHMRASVFAVFA